jgi:hypothetical protein
MIEWVSPGTAARPVPQPVATPLVWAAVFGGAPVLVALLNHVVGPDHPVLALTAASRARSRTTWPRVSNSCAPPREAASPNS